MFTRVGPVNMMFNMNLSVYQLIFSDFNFHRATTSTK